MKRRTKKWSLLCSMLAFVVIGSNLQGMTAHAGTIKEVFSNSGFGNVMNTSVCNNPENDVLVEDNSLHFPADSTEDTRVIVLSTVEKSEYCKNAAEMQGVMNIKSIPNDQSFDVAFSLKAIESYYREEGSLSVSFVNDKGLKVGVVAYDDAGNQTVVAKYQSCGLSFKKDFSIKITISSDNTMNVAVNGKTIFKGESPIDLDGRIGFLQSGSCEVIVKEVQIDYNRYDRPSNINVEEDFEEDYLNVNAFYSKLYSGKLTPAWVKNTNGMMMFKNCDIGCYFSTQYEYSNFECSFDVPYFQYDKVEDEEGNLLEVNSSCFVFSFGSDLAGDQWFGYVNAGGGVICNPGSITSKDYEHGEQVDMEKYADVKNNVFYSPKITVVDGQVTVEVKNPKTGKYDFLFSYSTGDSTPCGQLQFWSVGQNNFAIDNLKIKNLDKEPNILTVEENFLTPVGTEDWEYKPITSPYIGEEVINEAETTLDLMKLVPVLITVVSVLMLIGSVIFVQAKKNAMRRKNNEE